MKVTHDMKLLVAVGKSRRVQKYCSHECYILSRFGRKDAI